MTAFKRDALNPEHYTGAVNSMVQLNEGAATIMLNHEVHAATDVTGFGLLGHAFKMAEGSNLTLVFEESDLPLLQGALEQVRAGMIPGGGTRNREYYSPHVRISDEVSEEMVSLAFDPQTSGGLLISIPESQSVAMLAELHKAGCPEAAIVGRAEPRGDFPLELV
jgi:selenide,water dikinase